MNLPAPSTEIRYAPPKPFQRAGLAALNGPATHVLLYGGARSGKTYLWMMWLLLRALQAPRSTHLVLRLHFNHIKISVIEGTLPKVAHDLGYPGLYRLNRSDWYADIEGGSRIYFGGLDDKERTEKVLGQEHSTVVLNECSQISYSARSKAATRISQQAGLVNKVVYDENPPRSGHWTERLFIEKRDPVTLQPLGRPGRFVAVQMNPRENTEITAEMKAELESMSPRDLDRFWLGNFGAGVEQALWTVDSIGKARRSPRTPQQLEDVTRVVVVCDPSGCSGADDVKSDEVGIVVMALTHAGEVLVLEDATGHYGPHGPDGWGAKLVSLYHAWGADCVYAEKNFGGAMVEGVVKTADQNVPFRSVNATTGKHVRAEPVATLSANGKLLFCGVFPELEHQLQSFTTGGYSGPTSPDRADAMVWGAYALGVVKMAGAGYLGYMRERAEAAKAPAKPSNSAPSTAPTVRMRAPERFAMPCQYQCASGRNYYVVDGHIEADARDLKILTAAGFTAVSST